CCKTAYTQRPQLPLISSYCPPCYISVILPFSLSDSLSPESLFKIQPLLSILASILLPRYVTVNLYPLHPGGSTGERDSPLSSARSPPRPNTSAIHIPPIEALWIPSSELSVSPTSTLHALSYILSAVSAIESLAAHSACMHMLNDESCSVRSS